MTFEHHLCTMAILITADNNPAVLHPVHLRVVETKTVGFVDCSARSANLTMRLGAILIVILVTAVLVMPGMMAAFVFTVMDIFAIKMNGVSITQVEVNTDIASIGIAGGAERDNAGKQQ